MAKEATKIVDLLTPDVETVNIKDKFLHVPTISDGFTNTVNGTYVYAVEEDNGDYKVSRYLYNPETDEKKPSEDPVIVTDGNTIFFITHTLDTIDTPAMIEQEEIQEYESKEKQVLQAFLAFVDSEHGFIMHTSFLSDESYAYGEEETEEPQV